MSDLTNGTIAVMAKQVEIHRQMLGTLLPLLPLDDLPKVLPADRLWMAEVVLDTAQLARPEHQWRLEDIVRQLVALRAEIDEETE